MQTSSHLHLNGLCAEDVQGCPLKLRKLLPYFPEAGETPALKGAITTHSGISSEALLNVVENKKGFRV
uniref:Uncharacterized protein n=2 Tax=Oryza TaxID=4527 RepID=A0A0E0RHG4_ORYRU